MKKPKARESKEQKLASCRAEKRNARCSFAHLCSRARVFSRRCCRRHRHPKSAKRKQPKQTVRQVNTRRKRLSHSNNEQQSIVTLADWMIAETTAKGNKLKHSQNHRLSATNEPRGAVKPPDACMLTSSHQLTLIRVVQSRRARSRQRLQNNRLQEITNESANSGCIDISASQRGKQADLAETSTQNKKRSAGEGKAQGSTNLSVCRVEEVQRARWSCTLRGR